MELNGKVALVTGAARRVGREIAVSLARAGCDVAIHFNRSADDAKTAARQIADLGRRAELFGADLTDPARIAAMFAAIGKTFSHLDVLVNNASVCDRTPLASLTGEQWDAEMAVNARAAALCIRYASELMTSGGAIVNITDIAAESPFPAYVAYCASKAALLAMTKSAAKALAGRNIRVNAVAPGVVLWQDGLDEETKQKVIAQVPLKRPGCPQDIAAAVVFLASQDYITGQNLRVDGGWHMG